MVPVERHRGMPTKATYRSCGVRAGQLVCVPVSVQGRHASRREKFSEQVIFQATNACLRPIGAA